MEQKKITIYLKSNLRGDLVIESKRKVNGKGIKIIAPTLRSAAHVLLAVCGGEYSFKSKICPSLIINNVFVYAILVTVCSCCLLRGMFWLIDLMLLTNFTSALFSSFSYAVYLFIAILCTILCLKNERLEKFIDVTFEKINWKLFYDEADKKTTFYDRLLAEHDELLDRYKKLAHAMSSQEFKEKAGEEQFNLMNKQMKAMEDYLLIIAQRIDLLKK